MTITRPSALQIAVKRGATTRTLAAVLADAISVKDYGAVVTSAIDTTAAQNIEIKTQLANAADTVTLESYVIELIRGE